MPWGQACIDAYAGWVSNGGPYGGMHDCTPAPTGGDRGYMRLCGWKMAVRLGILPDSGLAACKLGDEELVLVASPAYLARAGTPRTIADLAGHSCLAFVMPSTGKIPPWLLTDQGADTEWLPPPRLRVADDVLGVVSLAQQGLGICQTYRFVAAGPLKRGELVQVLPDHGGRTRQFSLIYPPHKSLSSASRALIAALAQTQL